jgi:hypothetical protein
METLTVPSEDVIYPQLQHFPDPRGGESGERPDRAMGAVRDSIESGPVFLV